ncbi:hypothetical protein PENSPDRAFT_45514 [Peniophora sp. CONT]|nr:hypothetical protein PENSPDRAFT_45514 [Peniophora sp. CONT]
MTLTNWTPSFFPETPLRLKELDNAISSGSACSGLPDILLKIEDDIARLRHTAFQLLARRNTCAPLLSLPPELTTEIMKTLHAVWLAYSRPKTVAGDGTITEWEADMCWLQIGHVCRALRSIALLQTELWADTLQFFPRSMDNMLPHCGEDPLALYLDGSSTSSTFGGRPLQFCLENLPRSGSSRGSKAPSSLACRSCGVLVSTAAVPRVPDHSCRASPGQF